MKISIILSSLLVLAFASTAAAGQSLSGIPLDLKYFMSREQVEVHLAHLRQHKFDIGEPDTITYAVPARNVGTKHAISLRFTDKGLVEIADTYLDLSQELFDKYLDEYATQAATWKSQGIEMLTAYRSFYELLWRSERSYIVILGAAQGESNNFGISVVFTEITSSRLK